jgi:hypothetical protein
VQIGYGLAAPCQGRGFGSEAITAMTAWLLAQPDIARVRACTAAGNMASRRALQLPGCPVLSVIARPAIRSCRRARSRTTMPH